MTNLERVLKENGIRVTDVRLQAEAHMYLYIIKEYVFGEKPLSFEAAGRLAEAISIITEREFLPGSLMGYVRKE